MAVKRQSMWREYSRAPAAGPAKSRPADRPVRADDAPGLRGGGHGGGGGVRPVCQGPPLETQLPGGLRTRGRAASTSRRWPSTRPRWRISSRSALLEAVSRLSQRTFRFTGDVHAMPEGTPVVSVRADGRDGRSPAPGAARSRRSSSTRSGRRPCLRPRPRVSWLAAARRAVIDFGMRRMHGIDASLKAARAFYIAGIAATSNVAAGQLYGLPTGGTMAHSYIQAHEMSTRPSVGTRRCTPTRRSWWTRTTRPAACASDRLARELGPRFQVKAVRLDSGDLDALSRDARRHPRRRGAGRVRIFASGASTRTRSRRWSRRRSDRRVRRRHGHGRSRGTPRRSRSSTSSCRTRTRAASSCRPASACCLAANRSFGRKRIGRRCAISSRARERAS
jgi:hypothetical protein